MKNRSLLSVVMPVYNAEKHLGYAIQSVLNQTHKNLELIIINDGSTDKSREIAGSFYDSRIRYFDNETNSGIVFSRNRGVELSMGDFIGMVDADDVVYPEKFEKQINFLSKNPDFGLVGSWVKFIDDNGNRLPGSWKLNAPAEMIPSIMLFKNYFLQSAVLYKNECLKAFSFSKGYDIVEDYLIWYQMLKKYKGWNLNDYLVDYRIHNNSITKRRKQRMACLDKNIFKIQFKDLGINASEEEIELHLLIKGDDSIYKTDTLLSIEKWLKKLEVHNKLHKRYNQKYFSRTIGNRWLKACIKKQLFSLSTVRLCCSSSLFYKFVLSYTPFLKK